MGVNTVTIVVYCSEPAGWLSGAELLAAFRGTDLRALGADYGLRSELAAAAKELRVAEERRGDGFLSAEVHHGFKGHGGHLPTPPEGPVRVARRPFAQAEVAGLLRALSPGDEAGLRRIRAHLERTVEVVELTGEHPGVTELLAHVMALAVARRSAGLIEVRQPDEPSLEDDRCWGDPRDGEACFLAASFFEHPRAR